MGAASANGYKVKTLPTTIIKKNKIEVARLIGLVNTEEVLEIIKQIQRGN